jgi:hypothetical protein
VSLITSHGPSWQFIAIRVDSAKIKEITKTGVFSIDDLLSILILLHNYLFGLLLFTEEKQHAINSMLRNKG